MWLLILLILIPVPAFGQSNEMNCEPLDPRISIKKEIEAKVKASVSTVYKIAEAGGQVEGRAKQEIQNLSATSTDRGQLQARWIYLFCEMLRTSKDMPQSQKDKAFEAVKRAAFQAAPQSNQQKRLGPSEPKISVVGALPLSLWEATVGPDSVKFTERRLGMIIKLRNNSNAIPRVDVAIIDGCVAMDPLAAAGSEEILLDGEKLPDPLKFDQALDKLSKSTIQRIRVSGLIRPDSRDVPSLGMAYVGVLFPVIGGRTGAIILEPKTVSIKSNCNAIKNANTQPGIYQLLQLGPNRTTQDLAPEFRDGRLKIQLHVGTETLVVNPKVLRDLKSLTWNKWSSLALPQMYEVPDTGYPPTIQ